MRIVMKQFRCLIAVLFLFVIASINQHLNAQISDRVTVKRPGNVHPLARAEFDAGPVASDHRLDRMLLVLQPDPAQDRALEALLAAQQDPQSPQYHRWLTPETFGKMFGVSERDLEQVTAWLTGQGFDVEAAPSSRRQLLFSGTAAQVEAAFHTRIHVYN